MVISRQKENKKKEGKGGKKKKKKKKKNGNCLLRYKMSLIIFSDGMGRRDAGNHTYLETGHGRLFMHRDKWRSSHC